MNQLSTELGKNLSIVVIDDGSTDGTSEWIRNNYPQVTVLKGTGDLWWSGAINLGAKYAIEVLKCHYVLLWNNDVSFRNDYFSSLLRILNNSGESTIIGSKILVKENTAQVWSMGGCFNPVSGKYYMYGYFKNDGPEYSTKREVDWLTGMGTIIPSSVILINNYWNNLDFPQYHGDSDFTYRAKLKGYKIEVSPELVLYNSTQSSGIEHGGSLRKLFLLMTDNRSKSNFRNIFRFYQLHSVSVRAYFPLFMHYFKIFGGFIKWKILGHLKIHKTAF